MEQIDNAPQRDWAEMGWITHRTPTLTDTDSCEDVQVPRRICEPAARDNVSVNYRTIVPGQPWYSLAAQVDQPATAKPDQFAALERRVVKVEETMRQLRSEVLRLRLGVEPR
jgi:hypothetical protein